MGDVGVLQKGLRSADGHDARYHKVFSAAVRNTVSLAGLTGDKHKDAGILIERINKRRRVNGSPTDWEGKAWPS